MTNRVRSFRKKTNMTLDTLAELTGLSTSYLSRLESGGRGGSLQAMLKISRALQVPLIDITDDFTEQDIFDTMQLGPESMPKKKASEVAPAAPVIAPTSVPIDVPVYGTVAASPLGKGAFRLSNDIVDWAARPPALMMVPDLYALEVRGDSMSPKYEPGDIIYVHPHRVYRSGDSVVIQEPDSDNGEPQTFIKLFVNETENKVTTQQFNPKSALEFKKRPGLKIHKVMSNRDLFGI